MTFATAANEGGVIGAPLSICTLLVTLMLAGLRSHPELIRMHDWRRRGGRQQAHAVNSKGAVYNMTQTSVLIRHSCSQKRLVIVWLLLHTHTVPLSYFILERTICYTAVSLVDIILGG